MRGEWDDYPRYTIDEQQEGIDQWLHEYVGYGNWCEWWPIAPSHHGRVFSFKNPKHATMFLLRWERSGRY